MIEKTLEEWGEIFEKEMIALAIVGKEIEAFPIWLAKQKGGGEKEIECIKEGMEKSERLAKLTRIERVWEDAANSIEPANYFFKSKLEALAFRAKLYHAKKQAKKKMNYNMEWEELTIRLIYYSDGETNVRLEKTFIPEKS